MRFLTLSTTGIFNAIRPSLFPPMEGKETTTGYSGTGIGLSIVKAIMDAHNQQYGVKNWENGVEFWFTLDGSNS